MDSRDFYHEAAAAITSRTYTHLKLRFVRLECLKKRVKVDKMKNSTACYYQISIEALPAKNKKFFIYFSSLRCWFKVKYF
jgi:hypothetical protein